MLYVHIEKFGNTLIYKDKIFKCHFHLKENCFTMLYWFLLYSNTNQL